MIYLLYKKHIKPTKIAKLVRKIKGHYEKHSQEYFDPTLELELEQIENLIIALPPNAFGKAEDLFPKLTREQIQDVPSPSEKEIERILAVIEELREVIHQWDPDAHLVLYGSLTNGFCLEGISDIDLTLITESRKYEHPESYIKEILQYLEDDDSSNWQIISSENVYLLQCDNYCGYEVEICFNNITGLINSEYIRTLAEIDSRFYEVGRYIKFYISKEKIFTKMNKLNSFSVLCMLIVYLQDIASPPILPRIIPQTKT